MCKNYHIPRGILLMIATDVNMIIGISKEGQTLGLEMPYAPAMLPMKEYQRCSPHHLHLIYFNHRFPSNKFNH